MSCSGSLLGYTNILSLMSRCKWLDNGHIFGTNMNVGVNMDNLLCKHWLYRGVGGYPQFGGGGAILA